MLYAICFMKKVDIQKIQEGDFTNKKIILRADFNVALEDGNIKERFKLEACKKTVQRLASQPGTKIAIISHLGRPAAVKTLAGKPEGKRNKDFSLEQIMDELQAILEKKIVFIDDCIGERVQQALENLKSDEILLLENVRFYEGEEKNDSEFAKKLAENFDVFVNDAFSVCHRDQASVTGIVKFLDSYAGLCLQEEIKNLNRVMHEPEKPAIAIIGGAKIETKLPLIKRFEETYSHILVGGKIANEAIDQKMTFSSKVILPIDFAKDRLDIGPKTIKRFKEIIALSKVVVWNGPMGKFEDVPNDFGTRQVLDALIESDAFTLIGGGESVQVLEESGLMKKISFVSTGGGAMLEYLSGNDLPGIKALRV
ncbi:MAG: phosphoglycerate kinase [Candidatus Moranbacteria bacterium GW2011_GWD2_36_12]|nr:MAG: phosphoglycerate kinase [Candidatus Moranbacteria bacterium GW2011_GWD2_36_12]KKQ05613.1 MAG: phosphoglycerate kinase [Candidatus Moranbacteria bacterium GW2011_GWE2_36_40]